MPAVEPDGGPANEGRMPCGHTLADYDIRYHGSDGEVIDCMICGHREGWVWAAEAYPRWQPEGVGASGRKRGGDSAKGDAR